MRGADVRGGINFTGDVPELKQVILHRHRADDDTKPIECEVGDGKLCNVG